METKTVSSDWSNKVGSFIFENGIQSFHNNLQGEMIKTELKKAE